MRTGVLGLVTLNCWREARVWLVASFKVGLSHVDAICQELGLWWYRAYPQLGLDSLFLYYEAGLINGRLSTTCHDTFVELQVAFQITTTNLANYSFLVFNVAMGSYDGAETCELVGLFLLNKLEHLDLNIGLYRDDSIVVSDLSPQEIERKKKQICSEFRKCGLEISIEANKSVVNFLDITLDLTNGEYRPYMKPNNTIKYVSKLSNHPPAVTKNLPKNINTRLSKISINETVFKAAAPPYQAAIKESGYDFKLKFDPSVSVQQEAKKRTRKRKVVYFNPPWSSDIKTNVGKQFLQIVKSTFHKKHPLYKICNRSTMKVSYSCLPNIKTEISKHNKKILNSDESQTPTCNCRNKASCPVPGKCLTTNAVYQATVTREDNGSSTTYTGLASDFKPCKVFKAF